MLIIQSGYECDYEMRLFAGLFFDENDDVEIFSHFNYADKEINVYTQINYAGEAYFYDHRFDFDAETESKQMIKKIFTASCTRSLIHAAKQIVDISIPWGVMCGIRPAKNAREMMETGLSVDEVREIFKTVYEVTPEKTELALKVAENEERLLSQIDKNSVSIYIGIPFCPSRCVYCSFVSTDINTSGRYMAEFVDKLLLEIDKTAEVVEKIGAFVDNIYIGGGTPTTLSAKDITRICDRLHKYFDFSKIKEFTIEAGRPDTIDEEKLIAAINGGADRISINPQTMNEETLKKVGRTHSVEMVRECMKLARKVGFKNINMDLIAGLPGEDSEMFCYSLDEVIKLDPEDITVHSLCIKRAADFNRIEKRLTESVEMNKMLDYTQKRMKETGREPYYMYRQKNSSGNLENVGYAKEGYMSTYNINIMEEKQTIIALGGGGSTKLVMGDRIERIFNFKDPLEYIRRFDEILDKKDEIVKILGEGVK